MTRKVFNAEAQSTQRILGPLRGNAYLTGGLGACPSCKFLHLHHSAIGSHREAPPNHLCVLAVPCGPSGSLRSGNLTPSAQAHFVSAPLR